MASTSLFLANWHKGMRSLFPDFPTSIGIPFLQRFPFHSHEYSPQRCSDVFDSTRQELEEEGCAVMNRLHQYCQRCKDALPAEKVHQLISFAVGVYFWTETNLIGPFCNAAEEMLVLLSISYSYYDYTKNDICILSFPSIREPENVLCWGVEAKVSFCGLGAGGNNFFLSISL